MLRGVTKLGRGAGGSREKAAVRMFARNTRLERFRGFTLLELMIVISIIMILMAVAVPMYNQSIVQARESVLRSNLGTLRSLISQYRSNVDGTRAILEAAHKNGVRRVVYTSSVATVGFTGNGHPANEDSPVSLADMIGPYKRSKFMAEQVALEAGRGGMHVVIVNPTTPVGEQDVKPTPTGRIVVDFMKRKFPAYVETGLNLVDVRECAAGHVAALERGKPGERYILGGENLTLKQILDKLGKITGLTYETQSDITAEKH